MKVKCADCPKQLDWFPSRQPKRCLPCTNARRKVVPPPTDGIIDEVVIERLLRGEKVKATPDEVKHAASIAGVGKDMIYQWQREGRPR